MFGLNWGRKNFRKTVKSQFFMGFCYACDQLQKNGLYGGDFYEKWFEIIPVVAAAIKIPGDKKLSSVDRKSLEDAILFVIRDTRDTGGYHFAFGQELGGNLTQIEDKRQLSKLVESLYHNYLKIAGSRSDVELSGCDAALSIRLSSVDGDRARTNFVMHAILHRL